MNFQMKSFKLLRKCTCFIPLRYTEIMEVIPGNSILDSIGNRKYHHIVSRNHLLPESTQHSDNPMNGKLHLVQSVQLCVTGVG